MAEGATTSGLIRAAALRTALSLIFGAAATIGIAWVRAGASDKPSLVSVPLYWVENAHGVGEVSLYRSAGSTTRLTDLHWNLLTRYPDSSGIQKRHGSFLQDLTTKDFRVRSWGLSPDRVIYLRGRFVCEEAAGWPFRCVWRWSEPPTATSVDWVQHGSVVWLRDGGRNAQNQIVRRLYGLPVLPIWSGFALNILAYASPLVLAFALAPVLRRRSHRSRGLCPRCGYDSRDLPLCPECGTPRPVPVRSPTLQT